ncbi:hypothetical protein PROFUN_07295 [Planoprotostelium fungivorum]|uniref:tRNA-intron lyase n=1 Tax=Planoprotostelium fungivorum TaxID=1890364 RepID=A0A2P6NM33_9EUKA|nr:hypothetical protein PROFUN_07295 [Planoprotostelium fungivorum]
MDLFESGFYGKGTLSRSRPEYQELSDELLLPQGGFHRRRVKRKRVEQDGAAVDDNANKEGVIPTEPKTVSQPEPPIIKEPPVIVQEPLQLGLEEAFFLLHDLECLIILDSNGNIMDDESCWKAFQRVQRDFLTSYSVYRYYRCNRWVPKYGIKYGVDWVLYRRGPSHMHAEKAVITQLSSTEEEDPQTSLTWLDMLTMNRVVEGVKKRLTVCCIRMPKDLHERFQEANSSGHDLLGQPQVEREPPFSLEDVQKVFITEMSLNRWEEFCRGKTHILVSCTILTSNSHEILGWDSRDGSWCLSLVSAVWFYLSLIHLLRHLTRKMSLLSNPKDASSCEVRPAMKRRVSFGHIIKDRPNMRPPTLGAAPSPSILKKSNESVRCDVKKGHVPSSNLSPVSMESQDSDLVFKQTVCTWFVAACLFLAIITAGGELAGEQLSLSMLGGLLGRPLN